MMIFNKCMLPNYQKKILKGLYHTVSISLMQISKRGLKNKIIVKIPRICELTERLYYFTKNVIAYNVQRHYFRMY